MKPARHHQPKESLKPPFTPVDFYHRQIPSRDSDANFASSSPSSAGVGVHATTVGVYKERSFQQSASQNEHDEPAERTAEFYCFGSRGLNGRTYQLGMNNGPLSLRSTPSMENEKLAGVSIIASLSSSPHFTFHLHRRELSTSLLIYIGVILSSVRRPSNIWISRILWIVYVYPIIMLKMVAKLCDIDILLRFSHQVYVYPIIAEFKD
ncbi:hypothetical protein K1719_008250 [Acacia pycnantha]|nr:hypothetical protein K1719_008250 [Acacia pycnantha]